MRANHPTYVETPRRRNPVDEMRGGARLHESAPQTNGDLSVEGTAAAQAGEGPA
jgi:hypothetical protein